MTAVFSVHAAGLQWAGTASASRADPSAQPHTTTEQNSYASDIFRVHLSVKVRIRALSHITGAPAPLPLRASASLELNLMHRRSAAADGHRAKHIRSMKSHGGI